jgi:hypothetical protein
MATIQLIQGKNGSRWYEVSIRRDGMRAIYRTFPQCKTQFWRNKLGTSTSGG